MSIKRPVSLQGFVDCSEGGRQNFVNRQFHDHQVTTSLELVSLECELAVNVASLVPRF